MTQDKPYEKLTRADGRLLAQELIAQGLTSKTAKKKIGHLRAAFNIAKQEGKIAINPFEDVVPSIDDSLRRVPLDDSDMNCVRASFDLLRVSDQHLWVWLATTGMRLDEPFHITNDKIENGIRYVIVGKKTQSSLRRVPIPESVLSFAQSSITKPLFEGNAETAGKRIRYFLRKLGISYDRSKGTGDPSKVIHSLRHRAKDKLRAAGCPLEVQYELLGHEEVTVASGYGRGHQMNVLKRWVDEIGY
ncbi:tyrosine-type recombinase/integrase [Methylobacterium sp. Leaf100]|uniref:site-specific integrase n=1 Tax=Methylobacterium sp. Leaf100 TaxID=1736252 RepID=UPI001AEBA6FD|nr:tyrosine-type recombinase/integrase [Methylobacterium sp. Leaf100]